MRILVLGARGFIGQHVAIFLEKMGHKIIIADVQKAEALNYLLINPDIPNFETVFQNANADACINCMGAASVPESFVSPLNDYTLNTVRIAQMLEAIRKVSINTKFVHLSSAAVYGNPSSSLPIKESTDLRPLSPYGWHKYGAEQICQEYSRFFGLQTISLRIFSAYGPHLRKQLFWDIYQKALGKPNIELYGSGVETRDFIYVADIAHALHLLLQAGHFDGRAINVASGTASTIAAAARVFLRALDIKKEIVFTGSERTGDPAFWQADITYLQSLGFSPQYELQCGLGHVADWLKTL